MKKILILLLLIPFVLNGQVLRYPFYIPNIPAEEESGPPSFLTSDGYTYAWYIAAAENVTDDGGGVISAWADESGNNRNLSATFGGRPSYSSNSITFDGTSDVMTTATFGTALAQPTTIYMVMDVIDVVNGATYLSDANGYPGFVYHTGLTWYFIQDEADVAYTSGASLDKAIFVLYYNGANSYIRRNSTSGSATNIGTGGFTDIKVGGNLGGDWGHFVVYEIIVRNHTDSASEITDVMDYLNTAYSVY